MVRTSVQILLVLILISAHFVNCKNILVLLGIGSPSHHLWIGALINSLASRGHNLTILTVDVPKDSEKDHPNLHYIHLEEAYRNRERAVRFDDLIKANLLQQITNFYQLGYITCQGSVQSKGLQILLDYPNSTHFDLVLYEYSSGPCLLGFIHKFNYPPLVAITAFHNPPYTTDLVGSHVYPAYIPFFSMSYDVNMSFWERFYNTIIYATDALYRKYVYTPSLDRLVRPYFAEDLPYVGDLDKKTVLVLVNSHPATNYPESLPPNVIEVGGLQLVESQPLPPDLEEFINKSEKGAILVSLGTNMKSETLGPERSKIFIDAMTQLTEYNFLWKFDNFDNITLPKNVLIKSFVPQKDILGHKRLKAFFTHAGGLSIQEATWYGVPLIGMALFIDQKRNLHKCLELGVAEMIDYNNLTSHVLRDTIKKVAEEPRYSENMNLRSKRYRDRPMGALDTAVWWIEFVLRHPNPEHLQSPAKKLGFFRANCLDIYAFIVAISLTFIWMLLKICCSLFKRKIITKDKCSKCHDKIE